MTPARLQQLRERFPVGSINTLPADEVHRLLAHISTLESELQQVRVERDGLREALQRLCNAVDGGVYAPKQDDWNNAEAALAPAPAARTEEPL